MTMRCLLACLWLSSPALALDETGLADILETALEGRDMPGLRAAIVHPDGRIVRAAVGLADVEAGILLDNNIGMPGGSTGKTFVATLTVMLAQEGLFSLDDPAALWLGDQEWFGELPHADAITIRHLLTHSSGLVDYPATGRFNSTMIWRVLREGSAYFTPEELIGFAAARRGKFAPGEGYGYSDSGYLVLGRLIEAASGREYYDLLQEKILDPLDLGQIRPQVESAMTGVAMGYMAGSRAMKKDGRMKFDPRSEWTGGGLIMTPTDLARFYAALAEGRLLPLPRVQEMRSSGFQDPDQPGWHYGLGLFVGHAPPTMGHGGLWPGYRTHVTHFEDSGMTIAVQTNRDGRMELEELVQAIADAEASD